MAKELIFRYAFIRPTDGFVVWFGPHHNSDEARAAFQSCYGTWPGDYVDRESHTLTARI